MVRLDPDSRAAVDLEFSQLVLPLPLPVKPAPVLHQNLDPDSKAALVGSRDTFPRR